jgi:hypothetical protein
MGEIAADIPFYFGRFLANAKLRRNRVTEWVVLVSCQLAILEKGTNRSGPHWRVALAEP